MHALAKSRIHHAPMERPAGAARVYRLDGRPQPDRFAANEEPALEELLADPLTRRLMASDGLRHEALHAAIADARARLAVG